MERFATVRLSNPVASSPAAMPATADAQRETQRNNDPEEDKQNLGVKLSRAVAVKLVEMGSQQR